jgi:hypothetical protein
VDAKEFVNLAKKKMQEVFSKKRNLRCVICGGLIVAIYKTAIQNTCSEWCRRNLTRLRQTGRKLGMNAAQVAEMLKTLRKTKDGAK